MNCPYCNIVFSLDGVDADHSFPKFEGMRFHGGAWSQEKKEKSKDYTITSHKCPECKEPIMWLNEIGVTEDGGRNVITTTLLFPKYPVKHIPAEIPDKFAADFREAHDTLLLSPKASAALSRRCLQLVIREREGIQEKTLFAEVEKLLKTNKLPKMLADDLDAIRVIGNFAAHPIKDANTGEIVEVEHGEAEWTLNVLEDLLNFYFVQEVRSVARRDALNKKLKDAGKGPLLKS